MARELVNELTWSVSRDRLFRQCRRAYYYNYYGSWGGWDASMAEPRTRRLYLLKNLQSLNMWAGGIVHRTIAEALKRYAARQAEIQLPALLQSARRYLRQGWLEAVNREWLENPKKINLFELYYGNGQDLPREETEKVRQRIADCLAAFAGSPLLQQIIAAAYSNWKPVDVLDSFMVNDRYKVWCAIDFAYFDHDGHLWIIDWKTGSEYREELQLQLACYALFAGQRWQVPPERLRPGGVFLAEKARLSEYPITGRELPEIERKILESVGQMRSLLRDPDANKACEEDFPTCDDRRTCSRCNFRELCPAAVAFSLGKGGKQ